MAMGKHRHLGDNEFLSVMRSRGDASPVISETLDRIERLIDEAVGSKALEKLLGGEGDSAGAVSVLAEAGEVLENADLNERTTEKLENAELLERLLLAVPMLVERIRTLETEKAELASALETRKKEGDCPVCEAKISI